VEAILNTKKDIAKEIGIGERTLYHWMSQENFIAEWQEHSKKLKAQLMQEGSDRMVVNGKMSIQNIVYLANNAASERIRLDANEFIYESIYGKATTKIDLTAQAKQPEEDVNVLEEFEEIKE